MVILNYVFIIFALVTLIKYIILIVLVWLPLKY